MPRGRLLGIVAAEAVRADEWLWTAPQHQSMVAHSDGWGLAIYSAGCGWVLEKSPAGDQGVRLRTVAAQHAGEVMIAHVRRRTVGAASLDNTHPFRRGRWVFAHSGTVQDVQFLRRSSSMERLRQCEGETDSELLFCWLLTQLDGDGLGDEPASARTDERMSKAATQLFDRRGVGTCNFLLSNGFVLYANRCGPPLHLLERRPSAGQPGAVLVASDPFTRERWTTVWDRTLLRCEAQTLRAAVLVGEAVSPAQAGEAG